MPGRKWPRQGMRGSREKSLELGSGPHINPEVARGGGGEDEGTGDPLLSSIRAHQIPFLRHLRMITLEQRNFETIQLLKSLHLGGCCRMCSLWRAPGLPIYTQGAEDEDFDYLRDQGLGCQGLGGPCSAWPGSVLESRPVGNPRLFATWG